MKNDFGVIGGMGTAATETFIQTVNQLTAAQQDQDYLDYIVFNHASIPDRTTYIFDTTQPDPLPALKADVAQLNLLGVRFIVMTCNTAHYFLSELQKDSPVPIFSMPQIAVQACQSSTNKPLRVGIMATTGTIKANIYQTPLQVQHLTPVIPDDRQQAQIMTLIYQDIKANHHVDGAKFHTLLSYFFETKHCDKVILGCTELSVAQTAAPDRHLGVVDAQHELARYVVAQY